MELHLSLNLDARDADDAAAKALIRMVQGVQHARRVASRSSSALLTTVISHKMGRAFAAESNGEAIAMVLADVLEDVAAFCPQAVQVQYHDGERVRRAFPDLSVLRLDGSAEVWEVKPEKPDATLIRRLGCLSAALRRHGIQYRVYTPLWLHQAPRLQNARALHRQADRPVPASLRQRLSRALSAPDIATLGALRMAAGCSIGELYSAAAQGLFAVDIGSRPLGDQTLIRKTLPGAASGAFDRTFVLG